MKIKTAILFLALFAIFSFSVVGIVYSFKKQNSSIPKITQDIDSGQKEASQPNVSTSTKELEIIKLKTELKKYEEVELDADTARLISGLDEETRLKTELIIKRRAEEDKQKVK